MKAVHGRSVGMAATLMIFCILAMSVFTVLLLGAGAYGNITEISSQCAEAHACLSYIWTKVKIGDDAGKVFVREFDGVPALWIEERLGGFTYNTVIYSHDGWIYELFTDDVQGFSLGDGVSVVQNESLVLEQYANGLIKASTGHENVLIFPRGNEKAHVTDKQGDPEQTNAQDGLGTYEEAEEAELSGMPDDPEGPEGLKDPEGPEDLDDPDGPDDLEGQEDLDDTDALEEVEGGPAG
ncbi:MAG: DUF4860 domain-containing protein [Oscillospiraceae bacterium]|nr:DUF4860 domain-containing protein [Oscillospiraceae bacterium]